MLRSRLNVAATTSALFAALAWLSAASAQRAPRKDALGDSLPPGAVARLGTIRLRHGGEVTGVAFAPDGKSFVSSGGDNVLRLWETTGGKLRRQFYGHSGAITSVAFAPDGKSIASASMDGTVRTWDVENGQELHRLSEKDAMERATTFAIAFSPDGKSVATAGSDKAIHLWALGDEDKELRTLEGHESDVRAVFFLPDGKRLISGSADKTIRLWEVETGKQLRAWEKLPGAVKGLAISADGKLVAAGFESPAADAQKGEPAKSIFVWEIESGREMATFAPPHFVVSAVAFAPDSKTLAAAGTGLRLWDVASSKPRLRFEQASLFFNSVAFASDGKTLALGSAGHSVWLMDTKGANMVPLDAHQGAVMSVAFSANGQALTSVSDKREIRCWDVASGKTFSQTLRCVESAQVKRSVGIVFALSPDGQTLVAHKGDSAHVWSQASGAESVVWKRDGDAGQVSSVPHVAFAITGPRLAFTSSSRQVKFVEIGKNSDLTPFDAKAGSVTAVALSPDGKLAAVGTGTPGRPDDVDAMPAPGQLTLWDVDAGKKVRDLAGQQTGVVALAFAPNGRWLAAVGMDGAAHIWDLTSGKERKVIGGADDRISVLNFAPDGHALATAGEGSGIHVWEVATWKPRREFVGHRGAVRCLAFSPDGRTLASGSADTSVLLWDVSGLRTGLIEAAKLSDREREDFWSDLSSDDAGRANLALWALAADPARTVPFLGRHLQTAPELPKERMDKLIADLDHSQLAIREQASAELMKLGEQAEAALRQTLTNRPTLELQRRIEPLLKKMEGPLTSPELLRTLRSVEILEHIGTPDAKKLLEELAKGGSGARLTQEAKGAMERLAKRGGARP